MRKIETIVMTTSVLLVILLGLIHIGCDEGMNMINPVIDNPAVEPGTKDPVSNGEVKQPKETKNPEKPADPEQTEPEKPKEPETPAEEPSPTVTITTVAQADDKSVTISGTSTNIPEKEKVTVVLGDDAVTVKTEVAKDGTWTATVPAKKAAQLSPGTVAVKATAKKVTDESSFEIAPPPEPTLTINDVAQADDGSITISGTSTNVPAGETVDVALNNTVKVKTTVDAAGTWTATVPAAEAKTLPARSVPVKAAVLKATADSSFTYEPPMAESGQTALELPPGYSLPPELIPTEPTVLSADEQALIEVDEILGWDGIAIRTRTTNSPADAISLLPYKDREGVYELFIASIELPFFAEAAEKMKERNITLRTLYAESKKTGNGGPYDTFLSKSDFELNIPVNRKKIANTYFEENPQDTLHRSGHSYYWLYLEWYRLQLEHKVTSDTILLLFFRESAKKGYIQGLDNPFD